ncbi:MAG: DUF1996 domain-containing protein [Acidimicrobiales bacterium]
MVLLVLATAVVRGGWGAPDAAPAPGSGSISGSISGQRIAEIHTGPQGTVPQFVVKCGFSHTASNDPIVHPGMAGMSHSHDFFGNRGTDATSTAATLQGGVTTCNKQADTAAYWAPTLFDHGQPVTPLGLVAYYRPAPGVDPTTLEPFPDGLMMIAGDSMATDVQPVEVAAWTCGTSSDLQTAPPTCPPEAPLRARLTFPDCWDGEHLDSADHQAHVNFSHDGSCPAGYPVTMPQLTVTVRYPVSGSGHDLTLASGPTSTIHSDFLNAWDQAELTKLVDLCLHRSVVCNVASNRAEDEPQPVG